MKVYRIRAVRVHPANLRCESLTPLKPYYEVGFKEWLHRVRWGRQYMWSPHRDNVGYHLPADFESCSKAKLRLKTAPVRQRMRMDKGPVIQWKFEIVELDRDDPTIPERVLFQTSNGVLDRLAAV